MQLLKHLDGLIREEADRAWKPPEGQEGSQVLGSANQLFLKIRASLNRCVKLVSRGNTLLQLSGAFKVKVLIALVLPVEACCDTMMCAGMLKACEGVACPGPNAAGLEWHAACLHLCCVCLLMLRAACAVLVCWRAAQAVAQDGCWRDVSTTSLCRHRLACQTA